MFTVRRAAFHLSLGLLFALSMVTIAGAQEFGITAGWNRSSTEFDESPVDWESKNGFSVGARAGWDLGGAVDLRTELVYTRKGFMDVMHAVDEGGHDLGESDMFFNFDYVEIPVLARVPLSTSGKVRPYLLGGGAIAFEVSSKIKAGNADLFMGDGQDEFDIEDTESTAFGVIVGGGVEFEMGSRTMTVDLRYDIGMTEVYYSAKHRCLSAVVGIGF